LVPQNGQYIVQQGGNPLFPTIEVLAQPALMADSTGQFQVQIGETIGQIFV
jgi:hypothetical protein